jgi:GTPase Era involved in 16S rRNA processing
MAGVKQEELEFMKAGIAKVTDRLATRIHDGVNLMKEGYITAAETQFDMAVAICEYIIEVCADEDSSS